MPPKMTRRPSSPGFIIRTHYMEPLNLTVTELALRLGISRKTLSKILNERGSVSPDMALRLSRAFNTTPQLWLNLQQTVDLWLAENTPGDWQKVTPLPMDQSETA
ncbi:transcriptional regulator [Desulforhabdus sp. TSK]|nr:HigA family addiction module antitoxin [Desulforhabdus sp. TSK]GKT10542.1 transcriptional regulator [Desulforhabdus sp. TSK]